VQEFADMIVMVLNPQSSLDQISDPLCGPQLGPIPLLLAFPPSAGHSTRNRQHEDNFPDSHMQTGFTNDTIAAIATAEGPGGVAVVRISGPAAWRTAERVVRHKGPRLTERDAGQFFHAQFADVASGETVDDGLVLLFRAPASFTGEDVVELQGHGGPTPSRAVLRTVLAAGARLAEPGEFTRRAFLNGRLELTQAEAVMDLVHARSERAAQAARAQLAGVLGKEVDSLYQETTALCADVEAQLDFEAGELPLRVRGETEARLDRLRIEVARLLATNREGHLLRAGALVVIAGCPNAGKSSLLNTLLGKDRAIVSPIAGTTRDMIEEGVVLDGIPLRLMDTAGLRETNSLVEQEGVARAHHALEQADLVIYLIDSSRPIDEQHPRLFAKIQTHDPSRIMFVLNKIDLPLQVDSAALAQLPDVLRISLRTGAGLPEFKAALVKHLGVERQAPVHPTVTERHSAELVQADQTLARGRELLSGDDDAHLVLVAGELRRASEALGRIIGRSYTHDLLDLIFSKFCMGK
jgi:tRNA modification GTPase